MDLTDEEIDYKIKIATNERRRLLKEIDCLYIIKNMRTNNLFADNKNNESIQDNPIQFYPSEETKG